MDMMNQSLGRYLIFCLKIDKMNFVNLQSLGIPKNTFLVMSRMGLDKNKSRAVDACYL